MKSSITPAPTLRPQNVPPRPIDQQPIEDRLHPGKLTGHALSQVLIVPQLLRLNAAYHALGLSHDFLELIVRVDVEPTKPLKELAEILDDRVPEYLRLAILGAAQAFGQMRDQLRQLL